MLYMKIGTPLASRKQFIVVPDAKQTVAYELSFYFSYRKFNIKEISVQSLEKERSVLSKFAPSSSRSHHCVYHNI